MAKKNNIVSINFKRKRKPVVSIHPGLCLTPKEWLARELDPDEPLLGELFTTTARILFVANTGAGKTMLGLAWAFAMALGVDFLHWKTAKRKARVLYIDAEMARIVMQERIEEACKWFGVEPPDDGPFILSYEDFEGVEPLDTEAGLNWLRAQIRKLKPEFIFFDNIMSLCAGIMKEEESWSDMKRFVSELTKQRIGQLWMHHTGHDASRAYGTKTREWTMDTVIVAEKRDDAESVNVDLKFQKARRRSRKNADDFKPVFIELVDGEWLTGPVKVSTVGRPNKSDEIALTALKKASIDTKGKPVSEKAWKGYADKANISESKKPNARRMAFNRARDNLIEQGKVIKVGEQFEVCT